MSPSPNQKIIAKIEHLLAESQQQPNVVKAIRLLEKLKARIDPVEMGRKGGQKTAERGAEYFRQLAAMRKTRAGGRPRKAVPAIN
jgi:hypothetical protein